MTTKNRGGLVALAVAAPLLVSGAPAAFGAVATTETECRGGHGGQPEVCDVLLRPVFRAAAGEANRVAVTRSGKFGLFKDSGATVTAEGRCTQVDPNTVRCPLGSSDPLVLLDDGGDSLAPQMAVDAYGGEGEDTFTGHPGDDQFSGDGGEDVIESGAGNDILEGGAGSDRLTAGAGTDLLVDGETDGKGTADVYDGGEGVMVAAQLPDAYHGGDTIAYTARTTPITVDLAAGLPGPDGDTYAGIENAAGGQGADRLTAVAAGSVLMGDDGDDTLVGNAGPDSLIGNQDTDSYSGGAGDDRIQAVGPIGDTLPEAVPGLVLDSTSEVLPLERESLACGTGRDLITSWSGNAVAADCEAYEDLYRAIPLRPAVKGDVATFRCGLPCKGASVRLGPSGRYGAARFRRGGARVRVSREGLAALAAGTPIRVRYSAFSGYATPLIVP